MKRMIANIALGAALFASGIAPASSVSSAGEAPVVVPFELVNRHIFLRVTVEGRELGFLLDTGAPAVIIDLGRARELGLALGGELHAHGAAAVVTGSFLRGAKYTISGAPLPSDAITVALPLQEMASGLGRDFDGILGAEFVRRFVVEVDYAARVLRIHDRDTFAYGGSGETVPIRFNPSGHPVFDGVVTPVGGSPIPARIALDLGSGGSLDLRSPFVAAHHLPGPGTKTIPGIGVAGSGGDFSGKLGRVASVRIGPFTIDRPIAFFSEDRVGAFSMTDVDASVGERIVGRFRIFLDYARGRMILEPSTEPREPERAFSGASFEALGAGYRTFRARQVAPGGPAERAGIAVGDVIESIDGKAAADLTLDDVLAILEKPSPRSIGVRRGAGSLTVTLTPEPLA